MLLAAGADTAIRDGRHAGTPAEWAAHGNQPEARRLLDAG